MKIDTSKANRPFDAWIAEHGEGWTNSVLGNYPWQMAPPGVMMPVRCVPHYTADIAAAMGVIETLRHRGLYIHIDCDSRAYDVMVYRDCDCGNDLTCIDGKSRVAYDALPWAICWAAYTGITAQASP